MHSSPGAAGGGGEEAPDVNAPEANRDAGGHPEAGGSASGADAGPAPAVDAATRDDAGPELGAGSHGNVDAPALAGGSGYQLPFHVVDAEYSDTLDRIVIASDEPNRVVAIDAETGDFSAIALPQTPLAVSVHPDGASAAVAHDGFVSLVQLEPPRLLATHAVSVDAIDVVLAGNGYSYAFPRSNTWSTIASLELATGAATLGMTSVYGGTVGRLHPSGDRMYGADRGISPSDIERYDLAGGIANVAYDSPYHGGHAPCGNLWFTQDGARIVTACGRAFRASNARADDMLYAGALEGNPRVGHLDHSRAAGWLAVSHVGFDRTRELSLFEDAFLGLRQNVTLPRFVVGGREYAAEGRFTFFNRDGTRLYALVRAETAAPLADNFALARFEISARSGSPMPIPSVLPPPDPLPVAVTAALGTVLDFDVIDAEYSRALDRIVAVRANPSRLVLLNPTNASASSVDLPLLPTSIALAVDGTHAVVGHDGWVSRVDLVQRTVVNTARVSAVVGDLVPGPGGYAFAIPARDQWEYVYGVDLQLDVQTISTYSISSGTRARLHPSGTRFYAVDIGFQRYDMANGLAQPTIRANDSAHPGCTVLAFSEDGTRIFGSCGNVFRASNVPEEDMTYLATLAGAPSAVHMDHSAAARLLALARSKSPVSTPAPGEVSLFHDASLQLAATLPLPSAAIGAVTHHTTGRFVFFDRAGSTLHVLAQADAPAQRRAFILQSIALAGLQLTP
jgi:hypothetical protein